MIKKVHINYLGANEAKYKLEQLFSEKYLLSLRPGKTILFLLIITTLKLASTMSRYLKILFFSSITLKLKKYFIVYITTPNLYKIEFKKLRRFYICYDLFLVEN